ncbi:MAG: DUF1353 domain-containing protein [Hyphomicrobiaceae bacterium]
MRSFFLALAIVIGGVPVVSAQKYVGTLEFVPAGCEATRKCELKNDFGFIDNANYGWQAKAGDKTDGASIPDWAQPYVGKPFELAFIKAAVIHDHYCGRKVRTWLATHRVFYEGLLASGVEKAKALTMYYAVLIGGPKWIWLIPPKPCSLGGSCVFKIETAILPPGGTISTLGNVRYYQRPARFNDPKILTEIKEASLAIEAQKGAVTLDALVERAKRFSPGDVFLTSGSEIRANDFKVGVFE